MKQIIMVRNFEINGVGVEFTTAQNVVSQGSLYEPPCAEYKLVGDICLVDLDSGKRLKMNDLDDETITYINENVKFYLSDDANWEVN